MARVTDSGAIHSANGGFNEISDGQLLKRSQQMKDAKNIQEETDYHRLK